MKAYGEDDVNIHVFLISALVGGDLTVHVPAALLRCPLDRKLPSNGDWGIFSRGKAAGS
jgi:hypothetical protein